MNAENDFLSMLKLLERLHGVHFSEQFYKDLCRLVKTDKLKFIKDFFRDFSRINLKKHNRYEKLNLT